MKNRKAHLTLEERAQKEVAKKKGFYTHLVVYISAGLFFMGMNFFTSLDDPNPDIWFVYPMLSWGLAILIHYFVTFGIPGTDILTGNWEERQLEKERDKLYRTEGINSLPEADLDELELPELEKRRQSQTRWKDDDLV